MRVVMLYRSLGPNWNHGNAHNIAGARSELPRIQCRHTCAHRVDEQLAIHHELLQ